MARIACPVSQKSEEGFMNALSLFQEGKVRAAQQALGEWLRSHPADIAQRTFLFELLCFSGNWERAERQLSVLAQGDQQREMGAILYFSALHAERTRHDMFARHSWPETAPVAKLSGKINGRPFESICDADPAIGARLEIYAAGSYMWLPFEHIDSIRMEAPRRLRDTLWAQAAVRSRPSFHGGELGEILIPVLYPFSWRSAHEPVWLGRETRWAEEDGRERPLGQKMLLADGEELPFLEVRKVEFDTTSGNGHA
jgi:type VI secretion system protein ImpE